MQRLGSIYTLDERIGSGAQGEVWRGHADGSQEVLAFKVLRRDLAKESSVVSAFLKESETLRRVASPAVVSIRDIVAEGETLALVMDYVGGGDLTAKLHHEGPQSPAMVAWIGASVAVGLEAIHAAGVVHRDVKPANILLDPATDPPTPKVADFGVARICDSASTTRSTMFVGTPLYMAPEVADGMPASPAMDVYSLGIVLYELSCGVTPFVGTPAYLIKAHAGLLPGRPQGVPDALWNLIAAMTAKDPAARPTMTAVREALSTLVTTLAQLPPAPALTEPPQALPAATPVSGDQTMVAGVPATGVLPAVPSASAASAASYPGVPAGPGVPGSAASAASYPGVPGSAASAASYPGMPAGPGVPAPGAPGVPGAPEAADAAAGPAAPAKKRRRGLVVALVVALVLLGAGGAGAFYLLRDTGEDKAGPAPVTTTDPGPTPSPTPSTRPSVTASATASATPSKLTSMPDLVGKTEAEAKKALPGSITVKIKQKSVSDASKVGKVLETDPAAGAAVPTEVTLTIGAKVATIYLSDLKAVTSNAFSSNPATLNGQKYAHSIYNAEYARDSSTEWNLGRHFTHLSGKLGLSDNSKDADATFTVDFYADQTLLKTETVSFGTFTDLDLDMTNVLRLKIVVTRTTGNNASVVLGDAALEGSPDQVPSLDELNKGN